MTDQFLERYYHLWLQAYSNAYPIVMHYIRVGTLSHIMKHIEAKITDSSLVAKCNSID
jgi:hypothetical protein